MNILSQAIEIIQYMFRRTLVRFIHCAALCLGSSGKLDISHAGV